MNNLGDGFQQNTKPKNPAEEAVFFFEFNLKIIKESGSAKDLQSHINNHPNDIREKMDALYESGDKKLPLRVLLAKGILNTFQLATITDKYATKEIQGWLEKQDSNGRQAIADMYSNTLKRLGIEDTEQWIRESTKPKSAEDIKKEFMNRLQLAVFGGAGIIQTYFQIDHKDAKEKMNALLSTGESSHHKHFTSMLLVPGVIWALIISKDYDDKFVKNWYDELNQQERRQIVDKYPPITFTRLGIEDAEAWVNEGAKPDTPNLDATPACE